jgi:hypothetical protein
LSLRDTTAQPLGARQHTAAPSQLRAIWHKINRNRRQQTAGPSEEILPVRHHDWIAHFARRTPHKPAVIDLASERRLTYAQFDARIL